MKTDLCISSEIPILGWRIPPSFVDGFPATSAGRCNWYDSSLSRLIETCLDPLVTVKAEGKITHANDATIEVKAEDGTQFEIRFHDVSRLTQETIA